MRKCTIRKGFLTLRDCGNPAVRDCKTCKRAACSQHLASSSGFAECLECAARPDREPAEAAKADELSPEYAYRYRRRYYDAGYAPIYLGTSHSTYDNYDVRSFDSDMNDRRIDVDDSSTSSFGDS